MNGSWNEIFDKNSKIILGIMIVLIFLFMILLYKLGYFENKKRDEVLNQNYKVLVILNLLINQIIIHQKLNSQMEKC